MIELQDVSKKFFNKKVLKGISCSLEHGVYGLLGPNGAGKTTLLRCILGLYSFEGKVKMEDVSSGKVGYLPQSTSVFPGLTVAEQLEYFANLKGMKKREIEEEIDRVLDMVNLEEQRNVKGRKLSGGMIRRLGIGQAIMNHPKLVVFDEPTVGLDPEERLRFKRILHEVGKDCTILMSTHIVEDVESSCDKILILNRGRLVASGTQTEISAYAENRIYECSTDEVNQEDYIIKEFRRGEERMCRILSYQASEETTEKSSSVYRIPVTPTVEDGYLYILRDDKKHEK